jgi:hypothetical protein
MWATLQQLLLLRAFTGIVDLIWKRVMGTSVSTTPSRWQSTSETQSSLLLSIFSEHSVNIQWTFSEHIVNILWTLSEHSVNILWTFSEHTVNILWTLSEHSANAKSAAKESALHAAALAREVAWWKTKPRWWLAPTTSATLCPKISSTHWRVYVLRWKEKAPDWVASRPCFRVRLVRGETAWAAQAVSLLTS